MEHDNIGEAILILNKKLKVSNIILKGKRKFNIKVSRKDLYYRVYYRVYRVVLNIFWAWVPSVCVLVF